MSADVARHHPEDMLESGPRMWLMAYAGYLTQQSGFERILHRRGRYQLRRVRRRERRT